jgi:hypothetical protein
MATINLRGVPEELRNQYKALCALQGKTITDALIELIRREVEKGKLRK